MLSIYRSITGGDPPEHERPSADQLSALVFKLDSGMAPYADFAVCGPHRRRQSKLMRYTAQVPADGELVSRHRGSINHAGWESCWGCSAPP